jgi:hypothetical protein
MGKKIHNPCDVCESIVIECQNCTDHDKFTGVDCESLKAENERLKEEKKNNPWCLKCKSPDCLIELDGTCAMINIYLEAVKNEHN